LKRSSTVKLWNVATGKMIRTGGVHADLVYSLAFSPDGQRLATASWDKTAKIHDTTTGKELRTLGGHAHPVASIAFSPDGKFVATGERLRFTKDGSSEVEARLWDADSGAVLLRLRGHTMGIPALTFDDTGKQLITAGFDGTLRIWDATARGESSS